VKRKAETCLSPQRIDRYAAARKHIKENRGGRDDRPAGSPGATPMRRTKYPLGKPLVVHMTEARIAANKRAEDERTFAEKWHAVSGLIYIHPCDFRVGMSVHWHRAGRVLHGTVVKVNEDMLKPAKVLRKGPVRYHYTPSVYDFCDASGGKPCVCDLPIGQRTECQHKPDCPVPGIDAKLRGNKSVAHIPTHPIPRMPTYNGPPGVKLMQGHSPGALAGVFHNPNPLPGMKIAGSMMGPNEYAKNITSDPKLGDYVVRRNGIYLRKYNVRVATFAENCAPLSELLADVFADAHHIAALAEANAKREKLPPGKQIAAHQREERAANNGWYTHGCGQWVHDKLCPCSVCGPKRKPRKKK
jgi:hypothetical protein